MSYKIIASPRFQQELKRLSKKYSSIKMEYSELLDELEENPAIGIPLGNHCYKIRFSIESKGKGKSGGARIITYVLVSDTTVYLLSIYDKSEQAGITDKELSQMVNSIKK